MRRVLIFSVVLCGCGIVLIAASVAIGVGIGAIPYHDGPNAGFVSKPGLGRWIETSGLELWMVGIGLVLAALGVCSALFAVMYSGLRRLVASRA